MNEKGYSKRIPGDVVEDERWCAGVRVLERFPHSLTNGFVASWSHVSFVVFSLVVILSFRMLTRPRSHIATIGIQHNSVTVTVLQGNSTIIGLRAYLFRK